MIALRRMRPAWVVAGLFAVLVSLGNLPTYLFANEGSQRVEVLRLRGEPVVGAIEQFGPAEVAVRTAAGLVKIPYGDLLRWQRRDGTTPAVAKSAVILFANGEVFAGAPISADEERLRIDWQAPAGRMSAEKRVGSATSVSGTAAGTEPTSPGTQRLEIPLEMVAGLLFVPPTDLGEWARAGERIAARREASDWLWLANGDVLRGEFRGLDREHVDFGRKGESAKTPRSGVRMLTLNPELVTSKRAGKPLAHMTLVDGGRLFVERWEAVAGGRLRCEVLGGRVLELGLADVQAWRVVASPVIRLEDVAEAEFRGESLFGASLRPRLNANAAGGPLTVGGELFPFGVGLRPASELSFNVRPGDQFLARLALDDLSGSRADVEVVILLDDREVSRVVKLSRHTPAAVIRLPVAQGKRLTIRVNFGRTGDIAAYVDVLDPLLIRPESASSSAPTAAP